MANITDHNPLVLDTSATIQASATVKLKKARLVQTAAAAAERVIIQDGAGKEIAALAIPAAGGYDEVDFYDKPLMLKGLIIVCSPSPLVASRLHLYTS
jgi:hypothetical protein